MLSGLCCLLFGHQPTIWDQTADGVKVFRCLRCRRVRERDTSDPRPLITNTDPRVRIPARKVRDLCEVE